MPSTKFLGSPLTSLMSPLSMIRGTHVRVMILSYPHTLARVQHQRSCLHRVLKAGRKRPSRQLTSVRDTSLGPDVVYLHTSHGTASYGLGSSDDINTVAQFICDALTNTCKAGQLAKTLCTKATNAANAATPGTGAQADGSGFHSLVSGC